MRQGKAAADVGQSTMLPAVVQRMPSDLVAREFGEPFAKTLESLPLDDWQGPVASGFGAHLVRVTERQPSVLPSLVEVRPQALREWETARRERNRTDAYQRILETYEVVVEPGAVVKGAGQ